MQLKLSKLTVMKHFIFAFFISLPLPAATQETEVGLELVLLADASGSIDQAELIFQRQGYVDAIQDPMVLDAIEGSLYGNIAITYVEWATNQVVVAEWMIVDDAESAAAFANAILEPPRQAFGRNAIGSALLEGKRLIEENDIFSPRQVIDFSGDSMGNSSGPPILLARDEVLAAGITINALPILRPEDGRRAGANLEQLYADNIIGGPGSFMVTAEDRASFAKAVRRKLILEIAGLTPETYDIASR